ncbi:MAG TPA: hypothetical protein VKR06_06705 [Ktedonosporobacter sp.]|nr:hypothetical protein [Ktedonosporobacter sp.]
MSDIGLSPYTHYSGQPLWAWLYQLNQGGYAIVVANSSGQPTQQQLGYAVNTGPVQGMGGGAYLPTNYTLQSTIPKSGGYQFNLAAV